MEACTIIAKNYLAFARVLARSFAHHHPGGRMWTLIIDDFSGEIDPTAEPFQVLTPSQIGCEPFTRMALRYSVLELSTAVKPWLLRHLMTRTGSPVTYLDPDIKIYGSIARLDELASAHGLVLIPHNNEPIPLDGLKPSQVDIMIAGAYNLGYVSVGPGPDTDRLLDWWASRLERDCRVDPTWGYFVDQRWFDLAPGFVSDLAIVREPEYDVAYWNVHARRLGFDGDRYLVNGRPLAFFHFSGFDPYHPLVLSRYQNRVDVISHPDLERILAEYAADLLAEGHAESGKWPYSYSTLGDGTRADETVRGAYDEYADENDGKVDSPFTPEGARAFQEWLVEQAPGAPPGVSRALAHVYEDRSDLKAAYPDLVADAGKLLRWARDFGSREVPLLARTVAVRGVGYDGRDAAFNSLPAKVSSPASPAGASVAHDTGFVPLNREPWGVNVVGYFRSEVGTGEAARQVIGALDAWQVPTLPIHGQTVPLSRQGHSFQTATPEEAAFPVNLICMNADALPEFASQAGEKFFAGRYSIGLWFWEVSHFPERWRNSFALLEEVWAPTTHVEKALAPLASVPVSPIRLPVEFPAVEPRPRAELELPEDEFLFLFSFDYLSVFRRKNPLAVIEAFRSAFRPGEGAGLVLKCINPQHDPDSHEALRRAASEHPDVRVIDTYMAPVDNMSLTVMCDCYVSLHRAEGFGLTMAEAMWRGKPVIATGYSGNLDFMTPSNSLLVDYALVPIGSGAEPYPAEGEWAEPDIGHASTLMRQVFDDRGGARDLGERAADDIRRTHSPSAAGEIMYRRLESIRGTGRVRHVSHPVVERSAAAAKVALRIQQGPAPHAQGRGGRARELVRNVALRAMKPFTAYQQSVNSELVAAVDELSQSVHELREEAAAERAQRMADARAASSVPTEVRPGHQQARKSS